MTTKRKANRKRLAPAREQARQKLESAAALEKLPSQTELENYARRTLAESTGVKDLDLAAVILDQVSRANAAWKVGNSAESFQVATEMMLEMKPQNLLESMLAAQMIGVHQAALSCLERTASMAKSIEDLEAGARVSTRLMRLHMEQQEAMAKLRGKTGQQKVTVEHVHVHQGGQAIVGAISAPPKTETGGVKITRKKTS